jgi:hypothetical protein
MQKKLIPYFSIIFSAVIILNKYFKNNEVEYLINGSSYFIYLFVALSFSYILHSKESICYVRWVSFSLMLLTVVLSRNIPEETAYYGLAIIIVIFLISILFYLNNR